MKENTPGLNSVFDMLKGRSRDDNNRKIRDRKKEEISVKTHL
jgi:hypothetical protein